MGHLLSHPVTAKACWTCGNELFKVAAAEMQGYRNTMEDEHNIVLSLPSHPKCAMFAVYDGHSGNEASRFAAERVPEVIDQLRDPFDEDQLIGALIQIDSEFCSNPAVRNHGTTACVCIIKPIENSSSEQASSANSPRKFKVAIANVGDSRCFIIDKQGHFRFTTVDHVPDTDGESDRIYRAGGTVASSRVDGELAMSRSVGDFLYKNNLNLPPSEQKVIALPDVNIFTCEEGETVFLCCDGILETCNEQSIESFLSKELKNNQPAEVLKALLEMCLLYGSKDNMSTILVQLTDGSSVAPTYSFTPGKFRECKDNGKSKRNRHAHAKV